MDRVAWLLGASTRSSRILEIGAGYNPIAPKSAGWQTHVVDHASREELCEKYSSAGVNLDSIESVDTVWKDGPLDSAVPASLVGQFDTLIASHLIEHIPNLAGFLASSQRLIKPDGRIALAIPDKRFCFDYFRPTTTTGEVLDALLAGRTRHSLSTAWNQVAYMVLNEGQMAWGPENPRNLDFASSFATATTLYAVMSKQSNSEYADYHAWTFTPASFRLLILELGALGIADWRVEQLDGPHRFEFFASLRRGAATFRDQAELQAARLALLEAQRHELCDQERTG